MGPGCAAPAAVHAAHGHCARRRCHGLTLRREIRRPHACVLVCACMMVEGLCCPGRVFSGFGVPRGSAWGSLFCRRGLACGRVRMWGTSLLCFDFRGHRWVWVWGLLVATGVRGHALWYLVTCFGTRQFVFVLLARCSRSHVCSPRRQAQPLNNARTGARRHP